MKNIPGQEYRDDEEACPVQESVEGEKKMDNLIESVTYNHEFCSLIVLSNKTKIKGHIEITGAEISWRDKYWIL